MKKNKKIVVILGTTASGKTGLGVKLARKFDGEIVSADSRQVYRGMDVGTGKDLEEYRIEIPKSSISNQRRFVKIPYHLIDVVSPNTEYNLAKYKKQAEKAIDDILKRGRLPIVVGGTGLYLEALVEGYDLAQARPDRGFRERFEKASLEKLLQKIQKLDPAFAGKINESDRKNRRRLIRYLEILERGERSGEARKRYESLLIGLTRPKEELEKRIYKRLIDRLEREDMVGEVKRLHKEGVSWKRLESFGLEYRFVSLYLKGELTYEEMVEKLFIAIRQFAKRQMTWFRRWERKGAKIHWIKAQREALGLIKDFLK